MLTLPGMRYPALKRAPGPVLETAWSEAHVYLLHGEHKAPPQCHVISLPTANESLQLSTTEPVAHCAVNGIRWVETLELLLLKKASYFSNPQL